MCELITVNIQNTKLNKDQIKKICYFFSKDYTASSTATKLGLSRQTINHYYKIFRQSLIQKQDNMIIATTKKKPTSNSFILKYIKISHTLVFYIEYQDKIYFLENSCLTPHNILIHNNFKDSLLKYKRANGAKILFNFEKKEYFISRYFTAIDGDSVKDFIYNRLKQFRGVSKNNFMMHIKESQFRFNHSEDFILNTLIDAFK